MSTMYREQIMDHYKHPRNFGELPGADVSYEIDNPLCGDKLTLQLKFKNHLPAPSLVKEGGCAHGTVPPPVPRRGLGGGQDDVVADAKFTGTGCAISMASASLLTEYLKNKTRAELLTIGEDDVYKLLGTEINPGRVKCALLPLLALCEGVRPARRSLGEGGVR